MNNLWNRNRFFDCLKKWSNIYEIKFITIQTQYSTFIGQLQNPNETDSIAASLEIARRTYLYNRIFLVKDKEKTGILYPNLQDVVLPTHWKEMVETNDCKNWKKLYDCQKKSKLNYRFFLEDWLKTNSISYLSFESKQSGVFVYAQNNLTNSNN